MEYPFLDPNRSSSDNQDLIDKARRVVVKAAVDDSVLLDDELAIDERANDVLVKLVSKARDEVYHHARSAGLQFPIMQKLFCFCFAKGAEIEYAVRNHSDYLKYMEFDTSAAISGMVGLDVSEELNMRVNIYTMLMEDAFVGFQDDFLKNPSMGFTEGGRWLADGIAAGFYWAAVIGMNLLDKDDKSLSNLVDED